MQIFQVTLSCNETQPRVIIIASMLTDTLSSDILEHGAILIGNEYISTRPLRYFGDEYDFNNSSQMSPIT